MALWVYFLVVEVVELFARCSLGRRVLSNDPGPDPSQMGLPRHVQA